MAGVLVLLASACSSEDPVTRPEQPDPAPVLGASHVLLPMPGGEGLVLLTGPPETAPSDDDGLGVWQWDGSAWHDRSESEPVTRNYFSAAYDEDRDVVVLYGGDAVDTETTTVWEWDGEGWSSSRPAGPEPRMAAAMTYDAGARSVVLYGGDSGGEVKGDTWGWDGAGWTRLAVRGPEPVRWPAAFVGAGEEVVLLGGHQIVEDLPPALADTWVWDGRWRPVPDAGGPGVLVNGGAVEHPTLGTLVVGGSDMDAANGDVWRWAGERWELLAEDVFPERQAFGIGYDAQRDVVVLTGGVVAPGSTARHQDVWEWSGDPATPAERVFDGAGPDVGGGS